MNGETSLQAEDPDANALDAKLRQGLELHRQGRLADAERAYEELLQRQPSHFDALQLLGVVAYQTQRLDRSVELIERAIALRPDNAEAHSNHGTVLTSLRRHAEALMSFDKAIALNANDATTFNKRGNALRALRRFAEAVQNYDMAIAMKPDFTAALENRGDMLLAMRRPREALTSFDRYIALKPDRAEVHNSRGMALLELGQPGEALPSLDKAIAIKSDFALAFANRGTALRELERPAEASASFAKAIALQPKLAAAHAGMGTLLEESGEIEEAALSFQRAIALEPWQPRYYMFLARTIKLKRDSPHFRAMLLLADKIAVFDDRDKIDLHFALGQALAGIGDNQRAFEHQLAGNALRRRSIAYDEADISTRFERTRRVFSSDLLRRRNAYSEPPPTPIFIVGMPRSGSTLLEQALASHAEVFGAGESIDFTDAGSRIGLFTPTKPFPDSVPDLTDAQLGDLAREYLSYLLRTEGLQSSRRSIQRVTDKTLSNFQFLGLISMALPDARVIHIRRDPVDTCLSCFSQRFRTQFFTSDLGELGRYYRAYSRLMDHWRSVLPPGFMLEIQYENVVTNFESELRRIVAFCGLDWDDACLRFYETARPIRTASSVQVRRPIYQESLRRWRPDPEALRPLLEALQGEDEGGAQK